MTDYNDGTWHFWPGSAKYTEFGFYWSTIDELKTILNVHGKSVIEHYSLDSNRNLNPLQKECAGARSWLEPCMFRVVKEYKEPKTIWVNEYTYGFGNVHESEKDAIAAVSHDCIRVAVKYVEAQE